MISSIQNQHKLVKENGIEYYTIDNIKTVQSEMLRLLRILDQIAKENNISYWIASGSMIGVVRHHGFIPWDDDLDIELLKKDYIKLVESLSEYCKTHDEEFLYYTSPQSFHCCNYFASTKIFLRSQGSAHIYPVKVDIRPLNCIKNRVEDIAENNRLKDIANYKVFGKTHGFVNIKEAKEIDTNDFFHHYNYEYGLYNPESDDCLLANPYYEYSVDYEFKYKNLFPIKREKFEDIDVPLPNEYDYILTSIYGDYMKLPQICHRVPAACEVIFKSFPTNVLKSYFGKEPSNILLRKLRHLFFLTRFHGFYRLIKYQFGEKRVVLASNYEETKNNW